MGILEKIAEVEKEIGRTQKNKATEYHCNGLLLILNELFIISGFTQGKVSQVSSDAVGTGR